MRQLAKNIALALIGLLAAAAAFAGMLAGSEHAAPEQAEAERELLDLDAYCRDRYGDQAVAYQPSQVHRWGCSTWPSGTWGLEPVNLTTACRSQQRESTPTVRADASSLPPDQQVLCVE